MFAGRSRSMVGKPSRLGIWIRSSPVNLAYVAYGSTIKSGWIPPGTLAGAGAASGTGEHLEEVAFP